MSGNWAADERDDLDTLRRKFEFRGEMLEAAIERAERAEANVESMRADSSKNKAYREVAELAAAFASQFPSWVGVDEKEPDWPVLYIETRAGQVSYHYAPDDLDLIAHIPRSDGRFAGLRWDGHTREDRSARLAKVARHAD